MRCAKSSTFSQRFLLRFAVVAMLGNFAVAPAGAQQAADASSPAPQQFPDSSSMLPQPARATPYSSNEVIDAGHHFFGGISRGLASIVEKAVSKWGVPNGLYLGGSRAAPLLAACATARGGSTYGMPACSGRRHSLPSMPARGPDVGDGATEGLQQNVLRRPANAAKEPAGFGAK